MTSLIRTLAHLLLMIAACFGVFLLGEAQTYGPALLWGGCVIVVSMALLAILIGQEKQEDLLEKLLEELKREPHHRQD